MSQPFKLFRLQQIDSQIDRIHVRLLEIEVVLKEDSALRQAQNNLESFSNQLKDVRREVYLAELEVQSQRIKIEQTEASLYGNKIRNPKELQDLENEAASLKRYLIVLEDRQLDAMVVVETAEEKEAEAAAVFYNVRITNAKQNATLGEEKNSLLKDLHNQESERQATTTSILPEGIGLYEQLRQTRRGVAVAKVTDRACSACGTTLSAALLSAARSPHQITRCTTCGRILYAG